jgi:hypothetical protein
VASRGAPQEAQKLAPSGASEEQEGHCDIAKSYSKSPPEVGLTDERVGEAPEQVELAAGQIYRFTRMATRWTRPTTHVFEMYGLF